MRAPPLPERTGSIARAGWAALGMVLVSGCGGGASTATQTAPGSGSASGSSAVAPDKQAACGQILNGLAALTPDTVHLVVHRTDRAGYARASADLDTIRTGLVSLSAKTSDAGQKAQLIQFVGLVDGLKKTVMAGSSGDYVTAATQLVGGVGRIKQVRSGVTSACTG